MIKHIPYASIPPLPRDNHFLPVLVDYFSIHLTSIIIML